MNLEFQHTTKAVAKIQTNLLLVFFLNVLAFLMQSTGAKMYQKETFHC
jgi:hypothetical protein